MSNKKQSTYSLDESIRKDFQIECLLNDVNMSEAIEALMENYINISRKIRTEIKIAQEDGR
jgi:DNA-binding ferritin-like protein